MIEMPSRITDNAQTIIGYTATAGLTSSPFWIENVTTWLELIALIAGIAVGLTTVWFNIARIKKIKKGD